MWKKSVSAVLTYLAPWSSRIARPPKPSVRPRASRIGNMIRERKRSYSPPLVALLDQADRVHLLDPEARPLAGDEDLVPGARREADAEVLQRLLGEPALGQVLARLAGLLRLPEVVRVVGGAAFQQLLQALAALPCGLRPRVLLLALQLDPVAVGERLDRLGEPEPLLLHHEAEDVARHPAAEAVVELVLGVDREGRRALVVERAEAHHLRALPACRSV